MSYGTVGDQTVTSSNISALALIGSASVIVRLLEFDVGQVNHGASNEVVYTLQRFTASGTGTSVTPQPLDADRALAAGATAKSNHTAEPTYAGVKMLEVPVNQRGVFRWVAVPGAEPVSQLAADAGWGFAVRSAAYTGDVRVSAVHSEAA